MLHKIKGSIFCHAHVCLLGRIPLNLRDGGSPPHFNGKSGGGGGGTGRKGWKEEEEEEEECMMIVLVPLLTIFRAGGK